MRATSASSSTRTSASTRRSRLRCIRSAEPIQASPAPGVAEPEDARVLEVAAEHRAHADALGEPRHAGPQAADAAHDQVDLGARARRRVERVDRGGIGEAVHLRDDAPARPRLALDPIEQAQAQALGRDEQLLVVARAASAREALEQLCDVAREVLVAREQAEILVERGRDRVVVPVADVAVALEAAALFAHHKRELGVGLEAEHAVHDVRARALERARALQIAASSKRAFSSTSATICLPRDAAPWSACTMLLSDRPCGRSWS